MSDVVSIVLYATTLAPFAACALRYGLFARWRSTPVGTALMLLLGSITAVLVLALVSRAVGPDNPVVAVLRVVTLGGVQVAGWLLYRQIVAYQRHRPDDRPRRRSTDL